MRYIDTELAPGKHFEISYRFKHRSLTMTLCVNGRTNTTTLDCYICCIIFSVAVQIIIIIADTWKIYSLLKYKSKQHTTVLRALNIVYGRYKKHSSGLIM